MTIKGTIDTYRKRRQIAPLLIGIGAILLAVVGIVILVVALGGGAAGGWNPFASKTPTPTNTFTPTNTSFPSDTPTITPTPTETFTSTPSTPFTYTVKEGDTLEGIVKTYNLGDNGVVMILILNPYDAKTKIGIDPNHPENLQAGQVITLPNPGMTLPSPTPWPTNAAPGTRITYFVLPGDNLGIIANKTRSTVAAIVAANKTLLTSGDTTVIHPGWLLVVPVNLVTPVPSPTATKLHPTETPTATK